jgi:hypothetical protein
MGGSERSGSTLYLQYGDGRMVPMPRTPKTSQDFLAVVLSASSKSIRGATADADGSARRLSHRPRCPT